MKHPPPAFSRLYKSALKSHIERKSRPDIQVIADIGGRARAARLPLLELARFHERVLVMDLMPGCPAAGQAALIRHAGVFFAAVIAAADFGKKESARDAARLRKTIGALSDRSVELAAANRQLGLEIVRRGKVEAALRKSERECLDALENSEALREQLRRLSRQVISVQEEERQKISRELHDVVAQALLGINVRLASLKKEAGIHTKGLDRNISLTQKMVTKSANIVHRFARELRPAVLDDLGLVPALHSYMKGFMTRTGVRTHLTVLGEGGNLDSAKSTALYRVAQEALTNVARHAHASQVEVTLRKEAKFVCMEVADNGRSFRVEPVLLARGTKRLGLLGMRERVEMVGGCFEIVSEPGRGTTIIARVPLGRSTAGKTRGGAAKIEPVT